MLSVFQIPLIDHRLFVPSETNRLKRPSWPIPEPGKEFIRQFGSVRERNRGGISTFAGEEIFCRAANAIRLANETGIVSQAYKAGGSSHKLIFRRFFFGGRSVAKLEIGFRELDIRKEDSRRQSFLWSDVVHGISSAPCIVAPKNRSKCFFSPLIKSGKCLARLYLDSTSSHHPYTTKQESWWVSSGEPVLLFEYTERFSQDSPRGSKEVPINIHNVFLHYQRYQVIGNKLNVWYLGRFPGSENALVRNLRLHILRFHAEIQSLKTVLRNLAQGRLQFKRGHPSSELLQAYLRDTTRLITKEKRYGISQDNLLRTVLSTYNFVSAGERESLLRKLSDIRLNIYNSVERVTRVTSDNSSKIIVINNLQYYEADEIKQEGDTVTNYNINFGDHTTIHGNFVVAQSIQDSFNTVQESASRKDLKEALDDLIQKVTEISRSMPEKTACQIAEDLNILVKEALKPEPRRKWYEISADGIIEAAKTVGSLSASVIGAVKNVLALISG